MFFKSTLKYGLPKDSLEIKPWVQNFIPNIDEYNLCLISNIIFEMLQYVGMVANQDYDYDYDSVCKSFFQHNSNCRIEFKASDLKKIYEVPHSNLTIWSVIKLEINEFMKGNGFFKIVCMTEEPDSFVSRKKRRTK